MREFFICLVLIALGVGAIFGITVRRAYSKDDNHKTPDTILTSIGLSSILAGLYMLTDLGNTLIGK